MIIALQAVANNPELSDFVQAVQQRLPGLTAYLQAAAQPSGCEPPATPAESLPMEVETTAGTSGNAATGLSDEEGRKRVTQEITGSTSAGSVTESATSRPPSDNQQSEAPQPTLKSVVIPRPQFRVGHRGVAAP